MREDDSPWKRRARPAPSHPGATDPEAKPATRREAELRLYGWNAVQAVETVNEGPFRLCSMLTWLAAALFISLGTTKG